MAKKSKLRKCPCCTGGVGGGADAARTKDGASQERQRSDREQLLRKFRDRMEKQD